MQINISTRHGHLSAATQAKITSRVEKLLRYNDRLAAVDVTVDLEHKETPGVEFRVSVEKAVDLVATAQEENLMAAVESGLRKVEQQLRKHKEKMIDHRGTGRRTSVPDAGEAEMPEEG